LNIRDWHTDSNRDDAVVKIETLNVRTGLGTEYDIIAGVHRGAELEVIGQAGYGCEWLNVHMPEGTVGWVSGQAEYVTLNLNCTQVPVMVVPPTPTLSPSDFEVQSGKALFVFYNYTDIDWNIDIGPYFLAALPISLVRSTRWSQLPLIQVGTPGKGTRRMPIFTLQTITVIELLGLPW
jgi:hypothetical protein